MRWTSFSLMAVIIMVLCGAATGAEKISSPIKTVRFEPLKFNALTGLKIEPVLADESQEFNYEYRWFLNGEENYFETSDNFPGDLLHRGDKVSVEVTPVDAQGETLPPFISLPIAASNASPIITSTPPVKLSTSGFSYQVQATDPDGDSIAYRLEQGPEGMTIDSSTGNLSWSLIGRPEGAYSVKVAAEDEFGGRAEQNFNLNLSFPKKENK